MMLQMKLYLLLEELPCSRNTLGDHGRPGDLLLPPPALVHLLLAPLLPPADGLTPSLQLLLPLPVLAGGEAAEGECQGS